MQEKALVLRQVHAKVFRDEVAWWLQLACKWFSKEEREGRREGGER